MNKTNSLVDKSTLHFLKVLQAFNFLRKEMWIDFKRCFHRQWPKTRWLSAILIPAIVAVLIWLAFLCGDCGESDARRFAFFATLYCFWIGLFNACQTLNGAVETGEWSYWVLGFRRSFFRYYLANLCSVLTGSIIQVFFFLLTNCLLSRIAVAWLDENKILNIVNRSFPNELSKYLSSDYFIPVWLPTLIFLGLASLCAVISGASLGVLISAFRKRTSDSLKTAVAFIVLTLIASSLVLNENDTYDYDYIASNFTEKGMGVNQFKFGEESGKNILEGSSYFLPQRYFYNIATVLLNQNVQDVLVGAKKGEYKKGFNVLKKNFERYSYNKPNNKKSKKEILDKDKKELCRATSFIKNFLFNAVMGEVAAIFVWCFMILLFGFLLIKTKENYYELR